MEWNNRCYNNIWLSSALKLISWNGGSDCPMYQVSTLNAKWHPVNRTDFTLDVSMLAVIIIWKVVSTVSVVKFINCCPFFYNCSQTRCDLGKRISNYWKKLLQEKQLQWQSQVYFLEMASWTPKKVRDMNNYMTRTVEDNFIISDLLLSVTGTYCLVITTKELKKASSNLSAFC